VTLLTPEGGTEVLSEERRLILDPKKGFRAHHGPHEHGQWLTPSGLGRVLSHLGGVRQVTKGLRLAPTGDGWRWRSWCLRPLPPFRSAFLNPSTYRMTP